MKLTLTGEEAKHILAAAEKSGHAPAAIKDALVSIYQSNLHDDIEWAVECLNEEALQQRFVTALAKETL